MADTYDTTSQLQSNLSSQYQNTPSLRPFIAQLTNIMNTISNPEISPTQLPSLTEKYTDPATQNFLHEVVGIYNPVSLQNLDQTLFTKNTTNAINSGEKTLIVTKITATKDPSYNPTVAGILNQEAKGGYCGSCHKLVPVYNNAKTPANTKTPTLASDSVVMNQGLDLTTVANLQKSHGIGSEMNKSGLTWLLVTLSNTNQMENTQDSVQKQKQCGVCHNVIMATKPTALLNANIGKNLDKNPTQTQALLAQSFACVGNEKSPGCMMMPSTSPTPTVKANPTVKTITKMPKDTLDQALSSDNLKTSSIAFANSQTSPHAMLVVKNHGVTQHIMLLNQNDIDYVKNKIAQTDPTRAEKLTQAMSAKKSLIEDGLKQTDIKAV